MALAWIELNDEQSGWGPTRLLIASLSRDGYVAQVLVGRGSKVLIIAGRQLTSA